MKKLLYPLSLILTAFIILYSCSPEEETKAPTQYTLEVTAGEGGTVDSQGGTIDSGKQISITATPNPEYVFVNWSNGSTNNPLSLTINSNQNITANFEKKKYPLTISIQGEGTVAEEIISTGKTTEYDSGTTVRLTAEPSEGWELVGWSGAIESTDLEVQLLVSEAKTVSITFQMGNELAYLTEIRRVRNEIYKIIRDEDDTIGVIYALSIDLEDDGDLDLFVLTATPYNRSLGKSFIFKNENNFFEKINSGIGVPMSINPLIEDFDNDGLEDIIIPNQGLDIEPFTGGSDFFLKQTQNGRFEDRSNLLPHYDEPDITAGSWHLDLSNDGDLDVYFPQAQNNDFVMESGEDGFKKRIDFIVPKLDRYEITEENQTFFVPGSAPFNITEGNSTLYYYYNSMSQLTVSSGDFNGDGFDDLIFGGWNSSKDGITDEYNNLVFQTDPFGNKLNSSLKILFQNPETGELNYKYPESVIPVNDYNGERLVNLIRTSDVNGNECDDLIVFSENYYEGTKGQQIEILINNCNSGFVSSQIFELPKQSITTWILIELFDIDNDEDLDIIASDANQWGEMHLLENNHKVFINENGIFSERNGRTEDIQVLPPHIGINWYDPVQN